MTPFEIGLAIYLIVGFVVAIVAWGRDATHQGAEMIWIPTIMLWPLFAMFGLVLLLLSAMSRPGDG